MTRCGAADSGDTFPDAPAAPDAETPETIRYSVFRFLRPGWRPPPADYSRQRAADSRRTDTPLGSAPGFGSTRDRTALPDRFAGESRRPRAAARLYPRPAEAR